MISLLNSVNMFLQTQAQQASPGQMIISVLATLGLPILMLVLMYFLLIRPQRKEEKKKQKERDNLTVGDNVITIGGVVGRVINLKDDEVTISTSVANTIMTFRKAAIEKVIKPISDDE